MGLASGQPPAGTAREVAANREAWLEQQRAECLDEEQWLQEYCCVPLDEAAAFISYELMAACEDDTARRDFAYLAGLDPEVSALYLGFDVARTKDLSVIDVEERLGDVFWERLRIELKGKTFAEQEFELARLLDLRAVKRCCVDATGLGMQLAENMAARFGHQVESRAFHGGSQGRAGVSLARRARRPDVALRAGREAARGSARNEKRNHRQRESALRGRGPGQSL